MRKPLYALLSLLLVAALASCGDDDDTETGSGSASATGVEEEDDDQEASGGGEFCEQAETIANDETLNELDVEDPDDIAQGVDILEDWAESAPGEIEEDLDEVIRAFETIATTINEVGDDPEAQAEAFEELEQELEGFEAAAERIEDFVQEECGVDLSDNGSGSSDDTGCGDGGEEAGEPDEPPSIDDPELEELADQCFEGDGEACDSLFFQSPSGSREEDYGNTCDGRFDESPGLCATAIG